MREQEGNFRKASLKRATFEMIPRGCKGTSQAKIWRKYIPGRSNVSVKALNRNKLCMFREHIERRTATRTP